MLLEGWLELWILHLERIHSDQSLWYRWSLWFRIVLFFSKGCMYRNNSLFCMILRFVSLFHILCHGGEWMDRINCIYDIVLRFPLYLVQIFHCHLMLWILHDPLFVSFLLLHYIYDCCFVWVNFSFLFLKQQPLLFNYSRSSDWFYRAIAWSIHVEDWSSAVIFSQ